jgi:P2-related tail formation protein
MLVEKLDELFSTAPELVFTFRLALSAEGQVLDDDTLQKLNTLLDEVKSGWALH